MAILPLCPRAAAALPKTFARCNTAKAYPVLRRYNHLHFPISCPTKASFLWMLNHPKNEQKCPTGDLAPIPRDSCCPSKAECDNKNCSQVIERTSYFSFFPGHISCSTSLCQNVCFRTGALYCRTVRWRFDSSGSRGSVLSEQKSLPCPGACIIGFNDLKTINYSKTSWCALCRHFPWSQVIAGGRIAPRLPATWQGG